jgi:hypothetical protein
LQYRTDHLFITFFVKQKTIKTCTAIINNKPIAMDNG